VAHGWQEQQTVENIERIQETARELLERALTFGGHLAAMGQSLEGAVEAYNKAIGSWESRLAPMQRQLNDAGVLAKKAGALELFPIEPRVREVNARGGG
jgi:DNA recombination protein RmuC